MAKKSTSSSILANKTVRIALIGLIVVAVVVPYAVLAKGFYQKQVLRSAYDSLQFPTEIQIAERLQSKNYPVVQYSDNPQLVPTQMEVAVMSESGTADAYRMIADGFMKDGYKELLRPVVPVEGFGTFENKRKKLYAIVNLRANPNNDDIVEGTITLTLPAHPPN